MSSPTASSYSSIKVARKASKNPGLALNLSREELKSVPAEDCAAPRYSFTHSSSDTPDLEPDWEHDDDASDSGDDSDAQYVYIHADSPFYRGPGSPQTSAYLSFSGFPFACDALAQEDPLFAKSFGGLSDEELEDIDLRDHRVVVVESEKAGSQSPFEWSSITVDDSFSLNGAKSQTIALEPGNNTLHQYL